MRRFVAFCLTNLHFAGRAWRVAFRIQTSVNKTGPPQFFLSGQAIFLPCGG